MHNALDFIDPRSNFWQMSRMSDCHIIKETFVIQNKLVHGSCINFEFDGLEYTGIICCEDGGPYIDFIELI